MHFICKCLQRIVCSIWRLTQAGDRYGPCMSSTRLERWERAKKLKLNPPEEIMKVLKAFPEMVDRSVWHGRVHEDVKW